MTAIVRDPESSLTTTVIILHAKPETQSKSTWKLLKENQSVGDVKRRGLLLKK
jgi:hypothetical protein